MSLGTNAACGMPLDDRMAAIDDQQLVAVVDMRLGVVAHCRRVGQRRRARRAPPARAPCPAPAARPPRPRRLSASKISTSRSRIRSSAPSTFSSYSFSAGVMNRSPPAIGLLAVIVGGHGVQVGLGDFDVVAEDAIEANLERVDAGARALALLHLRDHLLARAADVAQLVELRVDAVADHRRRRVPARRVRRSASASIAARSSGRSSSAATRLATSGA